MGRDINHSKKKRRFKIIQYSIVIENLQKNYFTEKLLMPVIETVPIYWGHQISLNTLIKRICYSKDLQIKNA